MLLTRDDFRNQVFARDGNRCVICKHPGQDAHHILERRLFPDGGYYLNNGATLCGDCHLRAEATLLSVEEIRAAAGIREAVLPPQLYSDERYDKWGNPFIGERRIRGELFDDESVRKILTPVLGSFTTYVKYPRTYHFPFSPGISKDDRVANNPLSLNRKSIIITEKMDGENTTMYNDYIHARSINYTSHPSRDWMKNKWSQIRFEIPDGWRVCGENLYAQHSIPYTDLQNYFLVFSIWNDKNECLSYDDTFEYCSLLGLPMVPLCYKGGYDEETEKWLREEYGPWMVKMGREGVVARVAGAFQYRDFSNAVAKYVRADHVQTHGHWFRQQFRVNQLAQAENDHRSTHY